MRFRKNARIVAAINFLVFGAFACICFRIGESVYLIAGLFCGVLELFWIWMFIKNPRVELRIAEGVIRWTRGRLFSAGGDTGCIPIATIREVRVEFLRGSRMPGPDVSLILQDGSAVPIPKDCVGHWNQLHLELARINPSIRTTEEHVDSPLRSLQTPSARPPGSHESLRTRSAVRVATALAAIQLAVSIALLIFSTLSLARKGFGYGRAGLLAAGLLAAPPAAAFFFRIVWAPVVLVLEAKLIGRVCLVAFLFALWMDRDTVSLLSKLALAAFAAMGGLGGLVYDSPGLLDAYAPGRIGYIPAVQRYASLDKPILITLFCLPFLGLGGAFAGDALRRHAKAVRFHDHGETVSATLVARDHHAGSSRKDPGRDTISYSYDYRGIRHVSDQYSAYQGNNLPEGVLYTVGMTLPVRIDPSNPSQAVVRDEVEFPWFQVVFGTFFVALPSVPLLLLWRGWKRGTLKIK